MVALYFARSSCETINATGSAESITMGPVGNTAGTAAVDAPDCAPMAHTGMGRRQAATNGVTRATRERESMGGWEDMGMVRSNPATGILCRNGGRDGSGLVARRLPFLKSLHGDT